MPLKDTAHETYLSAASRDLTTLHSIGIVAVALFGILILFVPRRYVVIIMLIQACFISTAQRLVIAGLDFQLLRILIIVTFLRIMMRSEWRGFQWKSLDIFFVSWALSNAIMHILLMKTSVFIINRAGFLFDALGAYLVFRLLLQTLDDVQTVISGIIIISIPVAFFFILERMTGHNLFAIFGGVPAITWVRAGVRRCQGAFSHPILAGAFWASVIFWMASQFYKGNKWKKYAIIGSFCCIIIVIACGSSTPLLGLIAGIGIYFLYPLRKHFRTIFLTSTTFIVFVSLIFWTPPWAIMSSLKITPGATATHRVLVINAMLRNINEWWMFGLIPKVAGTWGRKLYDVTNEYLVEAAKGGLLTMVLFIIMIVIAFHSLRKFRDLVENNNSIRPLGWCLTVSLSVNCIMFMGVSYFGQTRIMWYLLVAMIASLTPIKGIIPGLATEEEEKIEEVVEVADPWVKRSPQINGENQPWRTPTEDTTWRTLNEDPTWRLK